MRERMRKREKERLTKKGDKSERDEEMGSRENIYLHLKEHRGWYFTLSVFREGHIGKRTISLVTNFGKTIKKVPDK